MPRPSPKTGYAEAVENLLIRDERNALDQGLGDQEAIERIFMGDPQPTSEDGMRDRDRESREILAPDDGGEVLRQGRGAGELSETVFGDDFHGRRRADEDLVVRALDRIPGSPRQHDIVAEPPDQGMGVEKDPQTSSPQAAISPSGRGSKNAGVSAIRPSRAPGRRGSDRSIRTMRATG